MNKVFPRQKKKLRFALSGSFIYLFKLVPSSVKLRFIDTTIKYDFP
jgi:hypothetical protein